MINWQTITLERMFAVTEGSLLLAEFYIATEGMNENCWLLESWRGRPRCALEMIDKCIPSEP